MGNVQVDPHDWVNPVQKVEIRQDGYKGKMLWLVASDMYGAAMVYARDVASAIWTAAGAWGVSPRSTGFHQSCRVKRVRG